MNTRLVRFLISMVFSGAVFMTTARVHAQSADDTLLASWSSDGEAGDNKVSNTLYQTKDGRIIHLSKQGDFFNRRTCKLGDVKKLSFGEGMVTQDNKPVGDSISISTGDDKNVLWETSYDAGRNYTGKQKYSIPISFHVGDHTTLHSVLDKLEKLTGKKAVKDNGFI